MTTISRVARAVPLAKRTFVPFQIESDCPACGLRNSVDLSGDGHLSSPEIGKPNAFRHFCDDLAGGGCGHEWTTMVVVRVELELEQGRVGDSSDVPADPAARLVALVSEARNALLPALHDLAKIGSNVADVSGPQQAIRRLLDYAAACVAKPDTNAAAQD